MFAVILGEVTLTCIRWIIGVNEACDMEYYPFSDG